MANIISSTLDNMINGFASRIASYIKNPYTQDTLSSRQSILSDYYNGDHRKQLKVLFDKNSGQEINDNITSNNVGLAIDRSVSRLFRGGIKFSLPKDSEAQQKYIDTVWNLNKKEITLYQIGLYGATQGTWYLKVIPDDIIDPYTNILYPRLQPINPRLIRIITSPDDMNDVQRYVIEYTYAEQRNGRTVEITHREITYHNEPATEDETNTEETWVVETWEKYGSAPWELINSVAWNYTFPPIIHCKNLPSHEGCNGDSEIDDVINLQDKHNFATSNVNKILKFHANPTPAITGVSASQVQSVDAAIGTVMVIPSADAKIQMLEMSSDLASSRAFANDLQKSIFSISRELDISSLEGQLGALTNFGLSVLSMDAINKNDTKRQLYGDALLELNRRLLVLNGYIGEQSRPGTIMWGEAMPVNIMEEMTADKMALELGIVDKETVARRYEKRYGVDWETIQKRIQDQQTQANAGNQNIGALILRNFNQGGVPSQNGINGLPTTNQAPTR